MNKFKKVRVKTVGSLAGSAEPGPENRKWEHRLQRSQTTEVRECQSVSLTLFHEQEGRYVRREVTEVMRL